MRKFETSSEKWQARYSIAKDNQSRMFRRFAKWYDLMFAAINTKDYAPWRSKVFLPILASKAWAMLAKFTALNPGFEVGTYDEYDNDDEAREAAQKAQWKLEHDWDNPDFDEPMTDKLFSPLMDAVVTGTGLAKTPWCLEKKQSYKHPVVEPGEDETPRYVDLSKDIVTTKDNGYNDLIPVNIFNVFIAPGAASLYAAEWIMIKEYKTLESLEESGLYTEKALKNLKGVRADSDEFAQEKKSRNRLTQAQDMIEADDTLDQIEIFECYEKSTNSISVFAVGGTKGGKTAWVELKTRKNPYWHGKYPLVPFYIKKRPYDVWGQGIFEDTERLQNAVQDIFNHFVDSYNLSVNGMVMKQEGERFRYVVQPGGELTYRNNPPQQFKFSDPNPAVFQQVMQAVEGAIEEATISSYATGTPDSATDKTQGTATGIRSLQSAAGDKIGFMKANYRTTLRLIGSQWLSNNQQFLASPVTVDGKEDGKPANVEVTPADLQLGLTLRINDASMEPVGKQEQLQSLMAYKDTILSLQQASMAQAQIVGTPPLIIDFTQLSEDISEKFGINNHDKIIISKEELAEQQQGEMGGQPQEPQQEQAPPEKPEKFVSYKDAPEDIKRQMEAADGFQPSEDLSPSGHEQQLKQAQALQSVMQAQQPKEAPNVQ